MCSQQNSNMIQLLQKHNCYQQKCDMYFEFENNNAFVFFFLFVPAFRTTFSFHSYYIHINKTMRTLKKNHSLSFCRLSFDLFFLGYYFLLSYFDELGYTFTILFYREMVEIHFGKQRKRRRRRKKFRNKS